MQVHLGDYLSKLTEVILQPPQASGCLVLCGQTAFLSFCIWVGEGVCYVIPIAVWFWLFWRWWLVKMANEEVLARCEWCVMVVVVMSETEVADFFHFSFKHTPSAVRASLLYMKGAFSWPVLWYLTKHKGKDVSNMPSIPVNIFLYLPSSPSNVSKIWVVARTKWLLKLHQTLFFSSQMQKEKAVWPCETKGYLRGTNTSHNKSSQLNC